MTQIQNSQPTEGGTVWCRCGDSCETDREKYYRLCETCWMLAADEYYANQAQAAEPSPQSIAVDYRRILEIAVNIPESKRPIVEQLFVRAIERGRVYRMRQDLTEEQRRTDAVLVLADMHRKFDELWRHNEAVMKELGDLRSAIHEIVPLATDHPYIVPDDVDLIGRVRALREGE